MDLVRGGNLTHLLNERGTLPLPYLVKVVDQVLDALSAVHARGIVHRDVKPSNLLLEPTGREAPIVRLSDFGIAGIMGDPRPTSPTGAVGTPEYAAPEQLAGAEPDPRQDMFATGIVLLRALTGTPVTT
ncbi:MAG: serine/threonine-protein kinase, partial [Pseudonocardiaceae bacterium]